MHGKIGMKIIKSKIFLFVLSAGLATAVYLHNRAIPLEIFINPNMNEKQIFQRYKNISYQFKKDYTESFKKFGDLEDIFVRKELVVCALKTDNNPFFQMKTGNGYIGEDIRLASKLGEALGVKVTYKMIYESNDDVVEAISRGEGDIGLAKLSYTLERARKVLYSSPYLISRKMVLISRIDAAGAPNDNLEKILNNKNSKISVMKNTSYESFARLLFPKAQLSAEIDWENGVIAKLEERKIMAAVRDELRIKLLLNSNPNLFLNFMPVILKGEQDSIAVVTNMKAAVLVSFINKFLEADHKQLTANDLIRKYEEYIK